MGSVSTHHGTLLMTWIMAAFVISYDANSLRPQRFKGWGWGAAAIRP